MAECDNCGAFVTKGYKRVVADNRGIVPGCPECLTTTEVRAAGRTKY